MWQQCRLTESEMETALWLEHIVQFTGFNHVGVVAPPASFTPEVWRALIARLRTVRDIGVATVGTISLETWHVIGQHPG